MALAPPERAASPSSRSRSAGGSGKPRPDLGVRLARTRRRGLRRIGLAGALAGGAGEARQGEAGAGERAEGHGGVSRGRATVERGTRRAQEAGGAGCCLCKRAERPRRWSAGGRALLGRAPSRGRGRGRGNGNGNGNGNEGLWQAGSGAEEEAGAKEAEAKEPSADGRDEKVQQAPGEEKKMCSPGWPRTRDPPASASFSKSYRRAPPQPAKERPRKHLLEPHPR